MRDNESEDVARRGKKKASRQARATAARLKIRDACTASV
jgi:hypothetical protein